MTATEGASERPHGVLRRAVLAWGHTSLRLEKPLAMATVFFMLFFWWWPDSDASVLAVAVGATATINALVLFSSLLCQPIHDRELCAKCLDAAPWLDPQGATDANDPWLRLHHDYRRMRRLVALGGLPILMWILMADEWWWPLKTVATVAALVGAWALWRHAHVNLIHRRLEQWCKYCRRPGGEDDHTPVPPPAPTGTRER